VKVRLGQGILIEGKLLVLSTSLYNQFRLTPFHSKTIFLYQTVYLNEEVNHIEPSSSVRVPWFGGRKGLLSMVDKKASWRNDVTSQLSWHHKCLSSLSQEAFDTSCSFPYKN
jgi:hypothetical protein